VAERLLAIQAQDPRGARLAVRARTAAVSAADVDRALTDDRSLLVTTLNRGTLHLVRSEDYAWLHALTTPQLVTGNARRLAQEGVSAAASARGVAAIERALADGPLTRDELRERVRAANVPTGGQAFVHVVMRASLQGLVVRGPMIGRSHAFVLVRDWLGELPPVDRDRALAELARRYLAGHGPADERDLAKWAGLPLRAARAGLGAIASELDRREGGLVALAGAGASELPPPRLLGAFEPVLMGWTSRVPILGAADGDVVAGGIFRPFALVRGAAAATWRLENGRVALSPFGRLSLADARALEEDAAAVVRYLAPERGQTP
jgi:winged helix DNA-binding protein